MSAGHPRRRADLEVGELAEGAELVLLDPATERVVSLNPSAAAVWYLCDGRRDAEAIGREVLEVLPDLEPARVAAEVERALQLLRAHQLVED